MNKIIFGWNGSTPLGSALVAPISRASVRTAVHGRPISLTLWQHSGVGLRIQSQMHDLSERIEVGVLFFDLVTAQSGNERVLEFPKEVNRAAEVKKLLIFESGFSVESGIVFVGQNNFRVIVVAGAAPYSLAMQGMGNWPHAFEPEYPVESYVTVPLAPSN